MTGFPKVHGDFRVWPPEPEVGDATWSLSHTSGWLPVIMADEAACTLLRRLLEAGTGWDDLDALNARYNLARPSLNITVAHLVDHFGETARKLLEDA